MSRSGYSDDIEDPLALARWRSAVRSAMYGRRGQAALKEMLAALDALPEKRLIREELELDEGMPFHRRGDVCALGALGKARGMDLSNLDPEDTETVAGAFNLADAMTREIVWVNDEAGGSRETPEQRFKRVYAWVFGAIRSE